jgi:hypothetical protein
MTKKVLQWQRTILLAALVAAAIIPTASAALRSSTKPPVLSGVSEHTL